MTTVKTLVKGKAYKHINMTYFLVEESGLRSICWVKRLWLPSGTVRVFTALKTFITKHFIVKQQFSTKIKNPYFFLLTVWRFWRYQMPKNTFKTLTSNVLPRVFFLSVFFGTLITTSSLIFKRRQDTSAADFSKTLHLTPKQSRWRRKSIYNSSRIVHLQRLKIWRPLN